MAAWTAAAGMLGSAAYTRMRAENPSEFMPRRVLLSHAGLENEIDRGNSFWVKAALVYESVTGDHVDDHTRHLSRDLLLNLAAYCCPHVHPDPSPPEDDQLAKRTQHPDEGTEENKQVIDAIFLVVGFLPRLTKAAATGGGKGAAAAAARRDAVDESFKATHMQDIVTDVIKLENQLPIKHLLAVADLAEAAVHAAAGDIPGLKDDVAKALREYKLGFARANFDGVIRSFCSYYSPFFSKDEQAKKPDDAAISGELTLLDCLHASLVPPSSEAGGGAGGVKGGKTSRIPTAKELRRSGVRLEAGVEDGRAVVQFKEDAATLRLPALVFDFKLATVARNLLARELEEQSKPVTRYFQLMNELVEEVADVRILRRAGVVRGGSRGAGEVHELIKKIDGYATYPSVFMAMDVQVEKVKVFHEKRMNNFFVRYRPAIVAASSVVAASVVAIVATRKKRG
ncbi:Os06g0160600 [Oryza sativa Japonica Group]|uniref:Os06g0160600 protein n=1 Tax=Oryza sativa subsp. japonica TaxID=39947 RepID=A0A0N7KLK6_ORYSJ|nr:Os06g0160600 [Oryza sativa Japonica Group]